MKYFNGLDTNEMLKKKFKELSKKLHPDLGGDEDQFKAMLAEYQEILEKGFCGTNEHELTKAMKDILQKVLRLQELDVELVGSWLWVSGNTYPHKSALRTFGFKWSKQRKKWYFHEGEFSKGRKNKSTFEDIKNKYGSEKIASQNKGSYLL